MKHLKKIATLVLILTFFYNVLGIYLVVNDQKEQSWVNAIENTTDSKFEIFEIKINPYAYIVDSGFEEVNEDVIINHIVYHVFKNRIQNNVLKLYCIKNSHKENLDTGLKRLVDSNLFGESTNKENPTKKTLKSFIKDYIDNPTIEVILNSKIADCVTSIACVPKSDLLSGHFNTNYPPPDMV
ncbi:hypothetical protein [Flavobacterium cheongpyeongense]|uniref:hypothetical protein n=1 Tax=Flavobacterium cheongpyeongense TaxID=2212651 RepID=UPI000F4D951E|nr:hypothetical protein [Flavobacterium cheongpyeongense]